MWEWFGDFNEGHLMFLGGWSLPVMVALVLGIVLVLVLSWLDLRDMRPRIRSWVLLGLRAMVLATGFLLLMEPAVELRDVERDRNHVAVLVDGSRSMTVEAGGVTRQTLADDALDQFSSIAQERASDHIFDTYRFSNEAEVASMTTAAATLAKTPDATWIRETIEFAESRVGRTALGGILLITDGIDSGTLGGLVAGDDRLDPESKAFLQQLEVPIHVLATGSRAGLKDVAIQRVLHDEFAFVRNRVAFDVDVRGLGLGGQGARVELWRDGERIRSQQVAFVGDDETQSVTFEVVPENLGKSVFSVVVPPLEDEAVAENNRYHFAMKVIRDKIRVLQVCGRPGWDERFTRRLLKENPNVDLISFFILRTNANLTLVPQDELSLIPFPKDELFDQELPGFDLVIFQNFNFGPYVLRRYLDNIAEFVRGGGGFLMLGGDLSFSDGGYDGTPVEEILPVDLHAGGDGDGLLSTDFFAPDLTAAGRRHPITRLAFDPQENRRVWSDLPNLEGTNIVQSAKASATVLATHPTMKDANGQPMPVVAVAEVEDGRSMSFTTDSSWLWSFEHTGRGGTSRHYTAFWNNAIRWLIQDPELKLIKVQTEEEQVVPGLPIKAVIEVLDPDYSPSAGAEGRVRVLRRSLDAPWSESEPELVLEDVFVASESGRFELSIPGESVGVYSIEAEVERGDTVIDDSDIVLVAFDSPELRDVAPRNEMLREMARATGGMYAELPTAIEVLEEMEFAEPKVMRINQRKLLSLWDHWLTFVLLAGLLASEWLLRRRWGRL